MLFSRHVSELQKSLKNLFSGEMTVYFYVLDMFMKNRILAYVNSRLIVTVRVTSFRECITISSSNLTSHVISVAAWDMALYSSSDDGLEMMVCFLLFQLIGEEPKRIR